MDSIVSLCEPLTVIGGGVVFKGDIALSREFAPRAVAADGGADTALSAGVSLEAVIGDMDSISNDARAKIPVERFHHIAEQDSTDFEKVLRSVTAPLVIAVGFSGGRIDHELATMHTLARRYHERIIVIAEHDIVFHCPRSLALSLPEGTRVSLFPMRPATGRSKGLHWPIDGLKFAPAVQSGTSNRATGDISLEMDDPGMLCILPRDFIRQVVPALLALPEISRWPAPA